MFQVGQKVVCVNDDWNRFSQFELPRKGQIYTVSFVTFNGEPGRELMIHIPKGDQFIGLVEIKPYSRAFWSAYFRPLVEPSIEVFEELLRRLPLHDPEPVS